jgi:integrase/recombinase XerD
MRLRCAIDQYVTFRQTLGERCLVNGGVLRSLSRTLGENAELEDVSANAVNVFLAGTGELTSSWHVKYNALLGFYRYALSRNLVDKSPLPVVVPKRPPAFNPYIYSSDEIRRLIELTASYQRNRSQMDPFAVRAVLLAMYVAALRTSEALSLTLGDVNLPDALLTVRDSKFFKSRLVPIGPKLTGALGEYARTHRSAPEQSTAPFFAMRNGRPINISTLENSFQRLRELAGIRRPGGARHQPRLHDLRHSSAVHRLTSWYRQSKNVQKLLPQLSVYLGHTYLAATQVYLTMTPELLHEASVRFERYVCEGDRA